MIASSEAALQSTRPASRVRRAGRHVQTANRAADPGALPKELLPQSETRFKASEAAYRSGGGNFLELLESERFRLNARVMTAMAEANLGMQAARLERAIGTDLPQTEEKK